MPTATALPPLTTGAEVESPLLTAEEFVCRPEPVDGSREELVRGKVVTMPPPSFDHGEIQLTVGIVIRQFVKARQLGRVVIESGLKTSRKPDSVRGPDVSFWSRERLPLDAKVSVYPDVAADLCVEVLSESDKPKRLRQKLREYFACGVRIVWVLDPDSHTVTIYREPDQGRLLQEHDTLTGEDVLPGFECRVSELFNG